MISILLATYNGEKYITEQLNSLLSQSLQEFKILVCDDCSTDNTYKIVKSYQKKFPHKIQVFQNKVNTGNAGINFMNMMSKHQDDYVMLCDQDDVWLPDKISKSLHKIITMERQYGKSVPLLIHTDLIVTDAQLNTISASFRKAMKANYSRTSLHQLIIQNTLTGCTAMYNRALANLIKPPPTYMVMHDWWLILIASAFGQIGHLKDQTILYRQHENNQIGAKDLRKFSYLLQQLTRTKQMKAAINSTYRQAQNFFEVYKDLLDCDQRQILQSYCQIPSLHKINKLKMILKLKTYKNGFMRNIAYLLLV